MDFALSLADRADAAVTALHVVETIKTRPELSRAMTELQKRRCDTELRVAEAVSRRKDEFLAMVSHEIPDALECRPWMGTDA